MEREIWFEKILWSYMPCHWKGWAAMAVVAAPTLAAIFVAQHVAYALGYKDDDWLVLPIFLLGWLAMMFIAKRHS
jgi:hypothetical protein